MIHRRLVADDSRGVAEPLNEKDERGEGLTTYTTHYLLFSKEGKVLGLSGIDIFRCNSKLVEKALVEVRLTIPDLLFTIIITQFQQNVLDNPS